MKKILVVDDTAAVRGVLKEFLEESGFEVIVCEDGEHAVSCIDKADALITDLMMPGMSGTQLTEIAKRQKPSMPVLIMTGRLDQVPSSHLADEVVGKPFLIGPIVSWLQDVTK